MKILLKETEMNPFGEIEKNKNINDDKLNNMEPEEMS